MKVSDLVALLKEADPDAVVLLLPPYADFSEAEELGRVDAMREPWTCERQHSSDGKAIDVHHPAGQGPTYGRNPETDQSWLERVVILLPRSERTPRFDEEVRMMSEGEVVKIDLPPEERFPESDVTDYDVRAEAERNRLRLLESGQLLSFDALQEALATTRDDVTAAIEDRRIFSVDVAGQLYYPAFFADASVDRNILGSVSNILGSLSGWLKWDYFTAARENLGDRSALDALACGETEHVLEQARRFRDEMLS